MVKEKKVAICVSTYNGEEYIKTQIESLLTQTYPNIEIFVRDDGSKDKTLDILKKYASKKQIHLIEGQNIGFVKSFYEVLKSAYNSNRCDYFAYCDQDDFWHTNKIEQAVKRIEKNKKNDYAILYFSDYNFCDSELNFIKKSSVNYQRINFYNSLVECVPAGMATLFNKELAKKIITAGPDDVCGHDWLAYMIATSSMGKIIYDESATNEYRRFENNVSPTGVKGINLQIYRIKHFIFSGYFLKVKKQINKFKVVFYNELDDENKKILDLFSLKYNPIKALKKTLYPKRFRQTIFDEILCRILFLFGKL